MRIILFLHNWAKRTLNFSFSILLCSFVCWLRFSPLRMPKARKQHYPCKLINYSYSKKIIRHCMEKYSLLTKLAKCTLNIALKFTFSVFLFFFVFWLHFRPPWHCLMPFLERQWKTVYIPYKPFPCEITFGIPRNS